MKRGFKSKGEEYGIVFRSKMNLRYSDFMDGFKLAEFLNIPVLFPSSFNELKNDPAKNNHDWSAITILSVSKSPLIIMNENHSEKRQQSDIMHELAHIICEHNPDTYTVEPGSPLLRKFNEEQEKEAEWLGGCLQLPRKSLFWALKKGMDESAISEYYKASTQMVSFRIRITGVRKQIEFMRYG